MDDYNIENEENESFYDDEFILHLTIEGTTMSEVDVKITDPNKTIRDQINSIVNVFELPKVDGGGNPLRYLLGQASDESGVAERILDFEDEDGREQCILDYGIRPGDHLHLVSAPIAG